MRTSIGKLHNSCHLVVILICTLLVDSSDSAAITEHGVNSAACGDPHFVDTFGPCPSGNRSLVVDLTLEPNKTLTPNETRIRDGGYIDTRRWRLKYVDEQKLGAKIQLVEPSIDARLANVLYTVTSIRMFNTDAQAYDLGSSVENGRAMQQAAGPQVDDRRCGEQLADMLAQVSSLAAKLEARRENSSAALGLSGREIRLAQVLDSYGRYESGHLVGKNYAFGSVDECAAGELQLGPSARTEAPHYCWARLVLEKHLDAALVARSSRGLSEALENVLQVGVCVPRSCHSASFAPHYSPSDSESTSLEVSRQREKNLQLLKQLLSTQFKLPPTIYIEQDLDIGGVYCPVDEQSQLASSRPSSFTLFLAFLTLWLLLVLCSTWLRCGAKGCQRSLGPLACLDMRESWAEFIFEREASHEAGQKQQRVELDNLNPVKIFLSYFVVFGHSMVVALGTSANQLTAYNLIDSDPILLCTIVGAIAIDVFFVITGVFFGYNEMKRAHASLEQPVKQGELKKEGPTNKLTLVVDHPSQPGTSARQFLNRWLRITVSRHLRLVPLFWLVFCFKKSVFPHLSPAKPLWDSGFNTRTNMGACLRESWFTPVLGASAFTPLASQCLLQSWTISADLFYSFFIPPVLILMPNRPKLAASLAALMIAVGTAWSYLSISSVHPSLSEELRELRMLGYARFHSDLSYLYTYPHYRFAPIFSGILAGYFLFEYKRGAKIHQWPRWFTGPATKLALLVGVLFYLGVVNLAQVKQLTAPYYRMVILHYFSTVRVISGLVSAIIILRLASDWNSCYLVRQFGKRIWTIAAKLNLALLLVHMDYLNFVSQSQVSNVYFSKLFVFNNALATVAFSIPLSILLHVVFENPVTKLSRRYVMPLIRV